MRFNNFPRQGTRQYGVLMVLPANHHMVLNPDEVAVMQHRYNADLALGNNYAVSRPRHGQHTETQLLFHLPTLIHNYQVAFGAYPPAILLYTRGTPCYDCATAIALARNNIFPNGQFVVAYTTNRVNNYMTPTINCQNRRWLRQQQVQVYCVPENHNQCHENDNIPCVQHNHRYG